MSLVSRCCFRRELPCVTRDNQQPSNIIKIESLSGIVRSERCMFGVMERLNYHHLLYFWMVAREGTMARACERLLLAQSTLSAQIATLEDALGEKWFERAGRKLRLTEMGRTVVGSADEIFSVGRDLVQSEKGRLPGRPWSLGVGG